MVNDLELARRAVACKRWRWMDGMRVIWSTGPRPFHERLTANRDHLGNNSTDPLPDLTDPATLGCLLALVREAWGDAHAAIACHACWSQARGDHYTWTIVYFDGSNYVQSHGDTEAAALVAALEAAP